MGRLPNQNDHILIERRWNSSHIDLWEMGFEYARRTILQRRFLVVAKVKEGMAVSKQAAQF